MYDWVPLVRRVGGCRFEKQSVHTNFKLEDGKAQVRRGKRHEERGEIRGERGEAGKKGGGRGEMGECSVW
eukprot:3810488-Rhodomonas_salina.1